MGVIRLLEPPPIINQAIEKTFIVFEVSLLEKKNFFEHFQVQYPHLEMSAPIFLILRIWHARGCILIASSSHHLDASTRSFTKSVPRNLIHERCVLTKVKASNCLNCQQHLPDTLKLLWLNCY